MHCRRSHITSNYPDPMLEGGCSHFDALPGAEKESLMLRTRAARQAFSPPPSELSSHSFKRPRPTCDGDGRRVRAFPSCAEVATDYEQAIVPGVRGGRRR